MVIPEAVAILKAITSRFPAKIWYSKIEDVIGANQETLTLWQEHIILWVGRGYNPTNVEGMLDSFQNGGLKKQGQQTSKLHTKPPAENVDLATRAKQRNALAEVKQRQAQ